MPQPIGALQVVGGVSNEAPSIDNNYTQSAYFIINQTFGSPIDIPPTPLFYLRTKVALIQERARKVPRFLGPSSHSRVSRSAHCWASLLCGSPRVGRVVRNGRAGPPGRGEFEEMLLEANRTRGTGHRPNHDHNVQKITDFPKR